jgi:type II secretory pathway component PulM
MFNQVLAKIRGWVYRPRTYLSGEWNRMGPRERRMVAGLGASFVVAVVVVSWLFLLASLQEIADSNNDAREALAAIAKHRDTYVKAKDQMRAQEMRIGTEAPQLAADLEAAAKESGVHIRETNPQPSIPAGKRYLEHRVVVNLRQVDLQSLSKFLMKLETGQRLIVITQMRVQRRYSEGDKLDVDMTATAFERLREDRPARKRAGTKA